MTTPRDVRRSRMTGHRIGVKLITSLFIGIIFIHPATTFAKATIAKIKDRSVARTAEQLSQELSQVASLAQRSVVNVTSLGRVLNTHPPEPQSLFDLPFFKRFFGQDPPSQEEQTDVDRREDVMASGVVIRSDGYILTNNHVVEQTSLIRVLLADQRELEATVVGTDPSTDLAVIKVNATGLPALSWGQSDTLEAGEVVLAVGNPFGLNQTVTMGIISAVGRANIGIIDYEDFIQTDAAINPGNSGGALLNLQGELIGINTAIFSEVGGTVGIGFAIPSQIAKRIAQLLITQGEVIRGWAGLSTQKLTPDLSRHFRVPDMTGVVITEVAPNGPAARAQLQKRDVIRTVNGTPVTEPRQLRLLIAEAKPGTVVHMVVLRSGHERNIDVKLRAMPKVRQPAVTEDMEADQEEVLGGVLLEDVPEEFAEDVTGIIVNDVTPGSMAHRQGLEPGDLIVEINDIPVHSMKDYERLKSDITPDAPVLLLVRRGPSSIYISIRSEQ